MHLLMCSMLLTWELWVEFLLSSFSLAPPRALWTSEELASGREISFYLRYSLCL